LGALFEESVLKALKSSFTDLIFLKKKYFFDTDSADFWPCTMYINTKFAILDS
jgi:hypothetical protein